MVGRSELKAWRPSLPQCFPTESAPQRSSSRAVPVAALLAAALVSLACHDRECEAARLELAQTWQTLRDTATSRQQIPEGVSLSQAEQDERVRTWKSIEDRAELLRSSFETAQVTWPSADKARRELAAVFTPLQTKEDPVTRGFAVTLSEADKRMATFRGQCH
jgi:hypothetical protein